MSMLSEYREWTERAHMEGVRLAAYACPLCRFHVETPVPDRDQEPYDTLCICPNCHEKHFRVVWADGCVEIS